MLLAKLTFGDLQQRVQSAIETNVEVSPIVWILGIGLLWYFRASVFAALDRGVQAAKAASAGKAAAAPGNSAAIATETNAAAPQTGEAKAPPTADQVHDMLLKAGVDGEDAEKFMLAHYAEIRANRK
jgi:hypothetical protein